MRIRLTIVLMTILLWGAAGEAEAQVSLDKVGQSTMNFQLVSLSARASALGDAVYAISRSSEAIFYNPAGLAETEHRIDASVMYTRWIADITYVGGALAWNLGDAGTVGISVLGVDYGTIHATSLLAASSQTQNVAYEDDGDMTNVGAYSFGVSYARSLSNAFSIGGTVRYAMQNLGQSLLAGGMKKNSAGTLVFDMGVKYYTGFRSFRFGMAFRNFGPQVKREMIQEQMPLTFTIGAAMDMLDLVDPMHSKETGLTLGVDFLHSNNYSERLNMGLEYLAFGVLVLRGGYQTNRDAASWSAGIGLLVNSPGYDLRLDYAYVPMKYFDAVNRIALGFTF